MLQEETVPFLCTIIRSQKPEPTRASPEHGQLSYPQEGRWSSASRDLFQAIPGKRNHVMRSAVFSSLSRDLEDMFSTPLRAPPATLRMLRRRQKCVYEICLDLRGPVWEDDRHRDTLHEGRPHDRHRDEPQEVRPTVQETAVSKGMT